MHDYQKPDRGWCGDPRRGAALGRLSDELDGDTLIMRRVPLDDGGYDPGGTYWGSGAPLFCVADMRGSVTYLRASDFESAKNKFPTARWLSVVVDGDMEDMAQAFAECALWLAEDDDGSLSDRYTSSDFSEEAMMQIKKICSDFITSLLTKWRDLPDIDWSKMGHELYLGDFSPDPWSSEFSDILNEIVPSKLEYMSIYIDKSRRLCIG